MIAIEIRNAAAAAVKRGAVRGAFIADVCPVDAGDDLELFTIDELGEKRELGHAVCTGTAPVVFVQGGGMIIGDVVASGTEEVMSAIAAMLGFGCGSEMQEWFQCHYGPTFSGLAVEWGPAQ